MRILLVVFFSFPSFSFAKEVVNKIVASINNEIVLLSELKEMPERIKKPGSIDETILAGDSIDSLKNNRTAQLNFLIKERLIESEIKRANLSSTDEQVDQDFSQMAKKNRMSVAEFSNYVAGQGYTVEEYKAILKTRSERQNLFEKEINSKLRITDDDAFGVFRAKYPNYRPSVGEYKIGQIFFSNKSGGPEKSALRAAAAYDRLQAGESFESLANQLDESGGGNKDGVLGVFKSGEFLPEIERAVSSISVGDTTRVLKGPNGFHIVKLFAKKTVLDPNFVKVKEAIKASLAQQSFERQLKTWFELKKLDAHIKIYDESL